MNHIKLGKFLSYILRHNPEDVGLNMDKNGWVKVDELIICINEKSNYNINFSILCDIVKTNNKQRYSFNKEKTKIRANQGHSIQVDVELKRKVPPDILFHGTATKYKTSIDKNGLISKQRIHVHLSKDLETAKKVGSRHGEILIYKINSKKMFNDGYVFYFSENGVWLTKEVPVKYLIKLKEK